MALDTAYDGHFLELMAWYGGGSITGIFTF